MARIEGQRNYLADYMSNFSRETQTRNRQTDRNSNKLTIADLKNYVNKSNKPFIIDKNSDY